VYKKQNPLTSLDYIKILEEKKILEGMSKVISNKVVLSPIHTKYQVVDDFITCISLSTKYKHK
jgi:hypothetical protein